MREAGGNRGSMRTGRLLGAIAGLLVAGLGCKVTPDTPDPSAEAAVPATSVAAASAASPPAVEVSFLDVGQGDAVLIRTPDGRTALVDAGRGDPTPMLRTLGVERIDLLVATHPHADHIGGIDEVLDVIPVGAYMDNGQTHTTRTYLTLMRRLEAREGVTYLTAEARTVSLGDVRLEVLPLLPVDDVEHNDRSVALVVRYGAFSTFLSGDSETRQLDHLVGQGAVPSVTVLKAAHHGSRNGWTPAFLAATRPEVVVISLGANNPYGHPHPESLTAYRGTGARVYRTDRNGTVVITGYRDGRYAVRTER